MPVTLTIIDYPAQPRKSLRVTAPEGLLERLAPKTFRTLNFRLRARRRLHIVFEEWRRLGCLPRVQRPPTSDIRPEDIWFAVVTQLSFHINANAEKLRSFFVEPEGQKNLEVRVEGNWYTVGFRALAERMTLLISENVKDLELRYWVMPAFSTTTNTGRDRLGALYGRYTTVADYENILARLHNLEQLGDEPTRFAQMLRPTLRYMILSVREPTSPDVISLWNRIASRDDMLSGHDFLYGWIAAFCYWNAEGKPRFLQDNEISGYF
ncbi:hypothetical protein QQZ08_012221 [Neonectria magnoliae]|uniref:Uncharacterized protein n=1 Tax=Neonectria magnoliae TaxID=2732573 RepID=A0ABR1H478_9HYPO